jgi:hypothetical protein
VDEETGLVYFGRRYYDPALGKWLTMDPLGLKAGPNLYAYVLNNPMTHFDLYGLDAIEVDHMNQPDDTGSCHYHVSHGIGKDISDRIHLEREEYRREIETMRNETAEFKQFVHEYPFVGMEKGQESPGFWTTLRDRSIEHMPLALDSLATSLDYFALASLFIEPPLALGAKAAAIESRIIAQQVRAYLTNKAARVATKTTTVIGKIVSTPAFKRFPSPSGVDKFSRFPKSVQDKMALKEAKNGAGELIPGLSYLDDPRFLGMEKYTYKVESQSGRESIVHFVRDPATGERMDFKFKKHSGGI